MHFPTTCDTNNIPIITEFWHTISSEETTKLLQSDVRHGLSTDKVDQRQQYFGKNELKETGKRSPLNI